MTTVAPFGAWPSPISAEMLATTTIGLGEATIEDGIAYWLEMRPTEGGRFVVVSGDPHTTPADVTPEGYNARSMVHEYGGGAFTVHHGAVFFSNMPDARLYRQDPGSAPEPITPETDATQRFADGQITPDGRWWIGVRERHDLGPAMRDVVNELVAVPTDGSAAPRTIAGGRDFYASPRISPDGSSLAWLAWDLPWMPWDGTELFVAPLSADGRARRGERGRRACRRGVDLGSRVEPDGRPRVRVGPEWLVEPGARPRRRAHRAARRPRRSSDTRSGAWASTRSPSCSDGRIACHYDLDGSTHTAILDPETGELVDLDLPLDALRWGPGIRAEGSTIVLTAGSATEADQVIWLDFAARSIEMLRTSMSVPVDRAYLSVPEPIVFPTDDGLTAHALFYPPTNPDAVGPDGDRPPLIVMSHGGPTGASSSVLDLGMQFFTSRGFGVVDVNYGGSTGYGRAYRQRLYGNWGVVDLHDCLNAARFLVERGDADGDRLLIRGGSAGGYTTMCALTFTDAFAAGTSFFGISDLVPFATGETHKFECSSTSTR